MRGLANAGYHPVAYTIGNFLIQRCLEQVRDEIGLHRYPIVLLGTGTGFETVPLGPTHHIVDDWGTLRAIPGIEIHCPSSVAYAEGLLDDVMDRKVAAYIRVPKGEYVKPASSEPVVYLPGEQSGVLLATYGGPAQACLQAQEKSPGLSVMVFNRLRPIDDEAIAAIWSHYDRLVIVEDHAAETGLYSSACQIVAKHRLSLVIESLCAHRVLFRRGQESGILLEEVRRRCAGIAQGFCGRAAGQTPGSRITICRLSLRESRAAFAERKATLAGRFI